LKKLFVSLLAFSFFAAQFTACSSKEIGEQEARNMLESAVFSPEQAFGKYKTFYMKTERIIGETSSASIYLNALDKDSYSAGAIFENKVVQELYVQDNKLRLSAYIESLPDPLELHIIYDGETLWTVSNFAQRDAQKVSFTQAKDFISFPKSDFFKRIRSVFEQSEKEIQYRYTGLRQYNGYKCHIIEMSLKGDSDNKAVFFIDKKTNVVIKTGWSGVFPNDLEVKKIGNVKGKKVPVIIDIFYGQYFSGVIKYYVKVNEYIHPDIFKEANILLPMRNMYRDKRFLEEKADRRRARIRVVLDSLQSFDIVLNNMHLDDFGRDFGIVEYDESITLPALKERLIPDDTSRYRIQIASNERLLAQEEKRKQAVAKLRAKKTAELKKEKPKDKNDETDFLEYNPRDAYKAIEEELEELKDRNPEEYARLRKALEEMKQKEERIKNMSN
jgi:hypothetical protein